MIIGKMRNVTRKILIVSIVIALCLCSTAALAYFSATSRNIANAKTGDVSVKLNESFPQSDASCAPIESIKTFYGANDGNKMAYVRAQVFPAPEYHFIGTDASDNPVDEWRPLAIPASAFKITIDSPDWVDGGDGYIYYSKILDPGADTTGVEVTVEINSPSALPGGMDIRLNVRVVMESAQVMNDGYKAAFGISALPAGVELVK